jgi:amidase
VVIMTGFPDDRAYRSAGVETMGGWLRSGATTSQALVGGFRRAVEDLDRSGPQLRAVLEPNPDAEAIARDADASDRSGWTAITGLPVLIKDNIDTADAMHTTAGSHALLDSSPSGDAGVVTQLRAGGAVIVGKANLSEWSNFRSSRSTSGWSGRGGLTRNPHALDRTPAGSSSGSAVAVAGGLVPFALGTETDGSIVGPACINGVVGIKPSLGLVPGDGVVPICIGQDTVGPFARSVRDAALVLSCIAAGIPDQRRAAIVGACTPGSAQGLRVGLLTADFFIAHPGIPPVVRAAAEALRSRGATVVEDVVLAGAAGLAESGAERKRLLYGIRHHLEDYLATRIGGPRTLDELIRFNTDHGDLEMPYFGQEYFEQAVADGGVSGAEYDEAVATCLRLGREEGIDATLDSAGVDCLIATTLGPAPKVDLAYGGGGARIMPTLSAVASAAAAGYPAVAVPAGRVSGLPIGVVLIGGAGSEESLLRAAFAIEEVLGVAAPPAFPGPQIG